MGLIIDGYNLLHATGIVGRGIGPGTLRRARGALLNFVMASVALEGRKNTTVVFDAKGAPPGLPRKMDHGGITVLFAAEHENADALIEALIRADSAPRRLTVVSSDHRIQRAAKRRRATAIDSDKWYARMIEMRRAHTQHGSPADVKPHTPLSKAEVERWLREFGDVTEVLNEHQQLSQPFGNPFPPGYAEDLDAGEREKGGK